MESVERSTIARLLATENISVVQGNVKTASFDVKNRVLTLPMWKDVSPHTEDHLIGHEVGHALYTPEEGWHEAICSQGPSFKSYLNVVEDARIEKLMLRKYPGLKVSFIGSYKVLLSQGFFGSDINSINKMGFIDRINTYFKCGETSGVLFIEEEMVFVDRIKKLERWEQVVKISEEIFQYCKEKYEEEEKNKEEESEDYEDSENDDEESDDGQESLQDYEYSDDDDDDDDDEEEDSGDDESSDEFDKLFDTKELDSKSSGTGGQEGGKTNHDEEHEDSEISSKTDESLRENIGTQIYTNSLSEVFNLKLDPMKNWKENTFSYKEVIKDLKGESNNVNLGGKYHDPDPESIEKFGSLLYKNWQKTNRKAVNHMVKEFEMRKSASEYARTSTSKTGVLDTLKMNNYKISDDIFKRVSVIPEGKNHGFIYYLDMSGSMSQYMYKTIEQTLVLAQFCKQINVPFRVYGFTDHFVVETDKAKVPYEPSPMEVSQSPRNGYFLELFSDKMKSSEMSFMAKSLLTAYIGYDNKKVHEVFLGHNELLRTYRWVCSQATEIFRLGGTPLNKSIAMAIPLGLDFRKTEKVDIMNTFFITDGFSHSMDVHLEDSHGTRTASIHRLTNKKTYEKTESGTVFGRPIPSYVTITNTVNKKSYKIIKLAGRYMTETDVLLKMYKDVTGSNVVGYRIEKQTKANIVDVCRELRGLDIIADLDDSWDSVKKDGWCKVENPIGYDEIFVIGSKSLEIIDNKMENVTAGTVSKAKLRTVFSRSQTKSKKSRKMLTELVEICA